MVKIYRLFGGHTAKEHADGKAKELRNAGLFAGVASVNVITWPGKKRIPYIAGTNTVATYAVYVLID